MEMVPFIPCAVLPMRRHAARRSAAALACAGILFATSGPANAQAFAPRPSPAQARTGSVKVWMRDAILYPLRDVPARVTRLNGSAAPTRAGRPIVLDDIGSYGVMVEHGELHIGAPAITALMNRYILPASKGPIKHVDVTFASGTIGMSGVLQSGRTRVGFKATAVPEATRDGDLRIRVVRMKAGGFVPKGVLDAVGLKLSRVAQPRNTYVFHAVGDDLIMPIVSMFPPPKVSGVLRSVRVTPREMVMVVGSLAPTAPPPLRFSSYIHYRGGVVRFAKLTMRDVDLTIVSDVPSRPLGFSPANYYLQLERGVTLALPDRGLVARVPDYATLVRPVRPSR
jgi:hypothetical protein